MREVSKEEIEANQAKQVLDNPAFRKSFVALEAKLFQQFKDTKWFEFKERTEIWRTLRNMNNLERYLEKTINNGKMIEKTLKR